MVASVGLYLAITGAIERWMDGWRGGWVMDGWVEGQMGDGWMGGGADG